MRRFAALGFLAGVLSVGTASTASAQDHNFLAEGAMAPDIEFTGATRYGTLGDLRLSEFRGETVILAFFFRARSSG